MNQVQARFFDGRGAAEQWVGVTIETAGLRLSGASGRTEAHWPFAELERIPGAEPPPLRLSLRGLPDARLVIEDPSAIAAITPKLPRRKDAPTMRAFLFGGLATAAIVASLWILAPIAARLAASLVPASLEEKWGEKLVTEIFSREARCEAEDGARALRRMVARLADASPTARGLRFEVTVMQDAMANAFALPGGQIVIMEGLLKQAEGGDEVAGVLAHEMGHVIARHAVERVIWRQVVDLGVNALFGAGYGADLAQMLVNRSHSRDAEREADRIALELLTRAGISTDGFAAFFERQAAAAAKLPGAGVIGYLSSHPPDQERKAAAAAAAGGGKTKPSLSEEEWRALKNICSVRRKA